MRQILVLGGHCGEHGGFGPQAGAGPGLEPGVDLTMIMKRMAVSSMRWGNLLPLCTTRMP